MDPDQMWAVLGKLDASKVPKYTKRRNHAVMRNLLERLGEGPPIAGPPFFQAGWHLLATEDGPLPEAHYACFYRFMCGADLPDTHSVTMRMDPASKNAPGASQSWRYGSSGRASLTHCDGRERGPWSGHLPFKPHQKAGWAELRPVPPGKWGRSGKDAGTPITNAADAAPLWADGGCRTI